MSNTSAATAVAPKVTNKDIAVNVAQGIFGALHVGFTALADATMHAEARVVNKIDKTITIQASLDYRTAVTNQKLEKMRAKMPGQKEPAVIE